MKKTARGWSNRKVFLLSIGITLLLMLVLGFSGLLQKPLATHAAWVYVLTHHPNHLPLVCEKVVYISYFGWQVTFREVNTGHIRFIGLLPDGFPVLVQRDTFRPLEDPFYEYPE